MPGYRVPGRVPEVWLTLMPPISLGTTAMPEARMIGSQAPRNAHLAVVQLSCGLTGGFSSTPPREACVGDPGSGAIRSRTWRWRWTTLFKLLRAKAAADPGGPQPATISRYFGPPRGTPFSPRPGEKALRQPGVSCWFLGI